MADTYVLWWREKFSALLYRAYGRVDRFPGAWSETPTAQVAAYLDDLRQIAGHYALIERYFATALDRFAGTDAEREAASRQVATWLEGQKWSRDVERSLEEKLVAILASRGEGST
jgi:hypothetical protein